MTQDTQEQECQEDSCKAPVNMVDPESGFCPAHGPNGSCEMAKRGSVGGSAGKQVLDPGEIGEIREPSDVRRATARVAQALAAGELAEKRGRAVIKALRLTLNALRDEYGAERVEDIREKLDEIREGQKRQPSRPWEE